MMKPMARARERDDPVIAKQRKTFSRRKRDPARLAIGEQARTRDRRQDLVEVAAVGIVGRPPPAANVVFPTICAIGLQRDGVLREMGNRLGVDIAMAFAHATFGLSHRRIAPR